VQRGVGVAVIGIGINYRAATDPRVRRRTASLEELVLPLPPRNVLIGRMTCELLEVLESFDASGLALLRGEWESLHAHAGHRIRLRLADGSVVSGIHTGVADDGALRVRTREGVRALHSARVLSARPA
jgi:BirA family biotin operon repressor/biotin-[acetyl-CoA-carboxylase] ligase